MADNSEKLENEAVEDINEAKDTPTPDETVSENNESIEEPSDAADDTAGEGASEEEGAEPLEDSTPDVTSEEAEDTKDAPAKARKNKSTEKSDEEKLEELIYAEEYRRKLLMEQKTLENSEERADDEEALRAIREEHEKEKEAAMLREKEESKEHSEKMSALLSRIEAKEDELAEKAASKIPEDDSAVAEKTESEEQSASSEEGEKAPIEDSVSDEVSEEKKADDSSMVISIDSDISSDILNLEGVSLKVGEEADKVPTETSEGLTDALPITEAKDIPSDDSTLAVAAEAPEKEEKDGYVPIPVEPIDLFEKSEKAPEIAPEVQKAPEIPTKAEKAPEIPAKAEKGPAFDSHREAALERDLDITSGVGSYVEYGTKPTSSQSGVEEANRIYDSYNKELSDKERKKLEKLELERLASAERTARAGEPIPEIIYPDKEITDDVLIAAGLATAAKEAGKAASDARISTPAEQYTPITEATPVKTPVAEEKIYPDVTAPIAEEKIYPDVTAPVAEEKIYPDARTPIAEEKIYPDVAAPTVSDAEIEAEDLAALTAMYAAEQQAKLDKKAAKKAKKDKKAKGKFDTAGLDAAGAYSEKDAKQSELERFGQAYGESEALRDLGARAEITDTPVHAGESAKDFVSLSAQDKIDLEKRYTDEVPIDTLYDEDLLAELAAKGNFRQGSDSFGKESKADEKKELKKHLKEHTDQADLDSFIKKKTETKKVKDLDDRLSKKEAKKLKKLLKRDSQLDLRYIKLHYDSLIDEKKLEISSAKMKFNKKQKKREKSQRELQDELQALRKEYKSALDREKRDNKRFYTAARLDFKKDKVRKGANRGELVVLHKTFMDLLTERCELNNRLINLYLGNEDGRANVWESRNAAELKGRRKAYKKQKKLEREILDFHISVAYANKLRKLMDEYVEKYGHLANLKVAIKDKNAGKRAKRSFKRDRRRTKRDLRRIEENIERYKEKAIREAEERRASRFGMAIGWTVFIGLCAMGIAVWAFWDDIMLAISQLLGR